MWQDHRASADRAGRAPAGPGSGASEVLGRPKGAPPLEEWGGGQSAINVWFLKWMWLISRRQSIYDGEDSMT